MESVCAAGVGGVAGRIEEFFNPRENLAVLEGVFFESYN